MLGDLDTERTHGEEIVDVLLRDFTGAVDLIGIHVRFEIGAKLREKSSTRGAIFRTLLGERKDAVEIVAADEEVARKAATFVERIARTFGEVKRRSLPCRHFGSVDHRSSRLRPHAGLFSDLLFRCFER